jgi:hypothetical protein
MAGFEEQVFHETDVCDACFLDATQHHVGLVFAKTAVCLPLGLIVELIGGALVREAPVDPRCSSNRVLGSIQTKTEKPLYRLIDNILEQSVIRRIVRQRAAGCSYKQIADQLNADGIPTKTGKDKWQCGNVAAVLNSKHTAHFLDEPEAGSLPLAKKADAGNSAKRPDAITTPSPPNILTWIIHIRFTRQCY